MAIGAHRLILSLGSAFIRRSWLYQSLLVDVASALALSLATLSSCQFGRHAY